MWLLLSRRLRRFILLSVAIPFAAKGIRALRLQVERRTGPTRTTRWLGHGEALAQGLGGRLSGRTQR